MWEVGDAEFANVTALPGDRRYEYFIKKVADGAMLWSLGDEHTFTAAADNEGRQLMPVWPHPLFATACATGEWEGQEPVGIDLDEWLHEEDKSVWELYADLLQMPNVLERARLKRSGIAYPGWGQRRTHAHAVGLVAWRTQATISS